MPARAPVPAPSAATPAALIGQRALIVSANATGRDILDRYCSYWGISCEHADTATSALEKLRRAASEDELHFLSELASEVPHHPRVRLEHQRLIEGDLVVAHHEEGRPLGPQRPDGPQPALGPQPVGRPTGAGTRLVSAGRSLSR